MTKRVCISGYYGFDNFGDELILKVLVENIKSFTFAPEITVFSANPEKTAFKLKVNSVPSFNLFSVIKTIMKTNCLISGGGSLLQDVTSSKSLIYYLGIIILAQLFRKKTIIFAQGIGPIRNKHLENLTKFVLKRANLITVRDNKSLNLLAEWGIQAKKCNDPVWNINIEQKPKNGYIGVQLRDCEYISEFFLNDLAKGICNNYYNRKIILFSLQNKIDLHICQSFKKKLLALNPELQVEIIKNNSNEKIIEEISQLSEFIAMRFHACLVALKCGVKVLPINYDIKVAELANEFDLPSVSMNFSDGNTENSIELFTHYNEMPNVEKMNNLKFNFKWIENQL